MDKAKFKEVHQWVKDELKRSTDFWIEHGWDKVHGGVYTCLNREGRVFSTDKSVWMQGRCGWTYAYLCSVYGKREEWLEFSKSCIDFLEDHCINHKAGGRLFFTVTEDGQPLRQRRYMFSEDFYTIANVEYYANTGETEYLERARRAYDLTWNIRKGLMKDPVNMPPKVEPETRRSRFVGDPMIYLNVTSIMLRCDPERSDTYKERAKICADDIIKYHYKPELKCLLENVSLDGTPQLLTTEGRIVNPGNDIEGSWFLAMHARDIGDESLYQKAEDIFKNAVEAGWDKEYEGLLYFTDCLGNPPEAYEHDMKMWWPHNEMLIATMMYYRDTGDEFYLDWFYKTYEYCKKYFADPEYGEWFGYLRRDGKPTEPPCKGSTFKGPFHVPRSLTMVDKMMEEIAEKHF